MRFKPNLPKVIGHRGAPYRAPENTMAGFKEAKRLGAPWVELDVQLSRDLVPVVFHDWSLERTSSGRGLLIETDYADLKSLDVGSWFGHSFADQRLPSFADVLDQLVTLGLGLNIEIKSHDDRAALTAEKALEVARAHWPQHIEPPLVTSFSRRALAAAKRTMPDWPRGFVTDIWQEDWRAVIQEHDCSTIHVGWRALDEASIRQAKLANIDVLAYVIDDPALAHQMWDWGVAAVFSDQPDNLIS